MVFRRRFIGSPWAGMKIAGGGLQTDGGNKVRLVMDATTRIEQIITPSVEAMGYEVVRVQLIGNERPVLQIMAERADRGAMTVEDCADISRALSALLDVEDPISGAYTLEISSPGIDRPLTRPQDFSRFAGFEAKVEMRVAVDGRKRWRGMLRGLDDGCVVLDHDEGTSRLPLDGVQKARLVLTEALIKATAEEAAGAVH
jgi:ribosome maturation factor RimP